MAAPADVDAYLAEFPDAQREVLQQVRRAIGDAVPGGAEKIRYGMPAVMLAGDDGRYALHFAGWKQHLALYPVPRFTDADPELEADVAPFRTKTDTVSFPWKTGVPIALIGRIARASAAMRASATSGDAAG
jgi:uncharacterized protein YdhG (YjbR/CyaY superfamily)